MSKYFTPNKKFAILGVGLFLAAVVASTIVVYLTSPPSGKEKTYAVVIHVCALGLFGASAGCALLWLGSKDFDSQEKIQLAAMARGIPGQVPQNPRS